MKITKEYIESVIWSGLGVAIYVLATRLPSIPTSGAGPRFFPKLTAYFFWVFALILMIRGIRGKGETIKITLDLKDKLSQQRMVILLAVVVYILIMPYIGFLSSTFLFTTALMAYFGTQLLLASLTSAGLSLVAYYVFVVFMNVPFPIQLALPFY